MYLASPGGSVVKNQSAKQMCVLSLGWEDPLEKKMVTTPVLLPGESHVTHGVTKELDVPE